MIKVIHSDNGGKYTDKDSTDFCVEECIKREWKTSYNPHPNGVVEKNNRKIVGVAKAMMYD